MAWPTGASPKAVRLGDPYRGTYGSSFTRPYNAANHLNLPTPSTPEAIHPDVLDMGTAWHGYRYWMAMTPYDGDENTETPCILATNSITDGGTWEVPSGFSNPITADQAGATHMADTDLVYDSGTDELVVFYIKTDKSTFQSVFSKRTNGGGTWGTETSVLAGALNTYINPSVIKVGTDWRIYYTKSSATDSVFFRTSSTGPDAGYGSETQCTHSLLFGAIQRRAQNINIIKDAGGTLCLVESDGTNSGGANGSGGLAGTLFFARNTSGNTFTVVGGPVLEQSSSNGWDAGGIYRASVLVDTTGTVVVSNGMIHVWYSAYKLNNVDHGTGYCQLPVSVLGG